MITIKYKYFLGASLRAGLSALVPSASRPARRYYPWRALQNRPVSYSARLF